MKKRCFFLFLATLLIGSASAAAAGLWAKYAAPDGSYSFHYPQGWKVSPTESVIAVENSQTDEELLLAGVPFDPRKSPADLAAGFIHILQESNPNIRASNWKTDPESGDSRVIFDLSAKDNGKQDSGIGIVIKTAEQATWFSYTAPAAGYSPTRGSKILQGLISSLASGSASKAPAIDYNINAAVNIDRNAQAFMFVLEFALGAPFTKSQEDEILAELKSGWRSLPETELQKYDQYPGLVQTILKMGRRDLEELRVTLEKSIREWLDESGPSDRVVKVIRDQLQNRGRVRIPGNPPLTEMALTAYSEMIAFSKLLRQNSRAMPEQISQDAVTEIKVKVLTAWGSLPQESRQELAATPGLWFCVRTLLRNASKVEQERVRSQFLHMSAETQSAAANPGTGTNQEPMSMMLKHNSLMAIKQMTFNTYMWSRGFNYLPAAGKMW